VVELVVERDAGGLGALQAAAQAERGAGHVAGGVELLRRTR